MRPATDDSKINLDTVVATITDLKDLDASAMLGFQVTRTQPIPHSSGAPTNGSYTTFDLHAIQVKLYSPSRKASRVKRPFRMGWPRGLWALAMIINEEHAIVREGRERELAVAPKGYELPPLTVPTGLKDAEFNGLCLVLFDTKDRIDDRVSVLRAAGVPEICIVGPDQEK